MRSAMISRPDLGEIHAERGRALLGVEVVGGQSGITAHCEQRAHRRVVIALK